MTYRKWAKRLIKKFGRDIRKFALTGERCPCNFFIWKCRSCKYSKPDKYPREKWCTPAEKYFDTIFGSREKINIIKKKILKRLNK